MPERPDQQIADDALLLRHWLKSEYFPPFQRLLEDVLEDAQAAVMSRGIGSDEDFYAVLEAKGRYIGLKDVLALVHYRIEQGEKVRRQ